MSIGKSCRVFLFVLMIVVLTAATAAAKSGGYKDIDAVELKALMDSGDPLVIFPLSRIEFNDLHITGSINAPLHDMAASLPPEKSRPLVFYCLGIKCTASWRAAEKAVSLGYRNVYAFRQGLPAWVEAGYPTTSIEKLPEIDIDQVTTDELFSMLAGSEDFVLLDVCLKRDAEKFWIDTPKRVHIPFDELKTRLDEIPRNKKVVVVCLKGKRSPIAVRYLSARGYGKLFSVKGGVQQWVLEGKPVKTI